MRINRYHSFVILATMACTCCTSSKHIEKTYRTEVRDSLSVTDSSKIHVSMSEEGVSEVVSSVRATTESANTTDEENWECMMEIWKDSTGSERTRITEKGTRKSSASSQRNEYAHVIDSLNSLIKQLDGDIAYWLRRDYVMQTCSEDKAVAEKKDTGSPMLTWLYAMVFGMTLGAILACAILRRK